MARPSYEQSRTFNGQVGEYLMAESIKRDYKPKGTSIGRGHLNTSSMNKRKKANFKAYRGQGK